MTIQQPRHHHGMHRAPQRPPWWLLHQRWSGSIDILHGSPPTSSHLDSDRCLETGQWHRSPTMISVWEQCPLLLTCVLLNSYWRKQLHFFNWLLINMFTYDYVWKNRFNELRGIWNWEFLLIIYGNFSIADTYFHRYNELGLHSHCHSRSSPWPTGRRGRGTPSWWCSTARTGCWADRLPSQTSPQWCSCEASTTHQGCARHVSTKTLLYINNIY